MSILEGKPFLLSNNINDKEGMKIMDILKMNVSDFFNIIKPFIIMVIVYGFAGIYLKSKSITFDRILAMFKVIFYLMLTVLSFTLSVEIVNGNVKTSFELAKELSLGQLLVATISILEIGSNLVTFFKLPTSEYKYINREEYREYKSDSRIEISELKLRLFNLEKMNEKNTE